MATNPYRFNPGFPQDLTIVDPERIVMPAWAYFFRALWYRTGSSVAVPDSIYISFGTNTNGDRVPFIFEINGVAIGELATTTPKQDPEIINLSTSPFVFSPAVSGFLTVPGARVEYSRQGGNYYLVSLVGGQITVLVGDSVKISWFNEAGPPDPVVWWAGGFVE